MLFLARFAARSRWRAVAAAAPLSLTPLFAVSAAVVALVTMRRGGREGAVVMLWALLPAAALFALGRQAASQAELAGPTLLGCWLLSWTLRRFNSWPLVLLGCSAFGLAAAAVAETLSGVDLNQVAEAINTLLQARMAASDSAAAAAAFTDDDVAAMIGAICGYLLALSAILGRHWQAALFNPGGFQKEFHALRLPLWVALVAMIGVLWSLQLEPSYAAQMHVWLFALPLLFSGLARVHDTVARKGWGLGALALVYTAAALFPFAKFALVGVGFADSVLRFAAGLRRGKPTDKEGE